MDLDYYLFLDESGDHGLKNIDCNFPVFALCGIITSKDDYETIRENFNNVKQTYWADKKVIFHSRDIRKCEKEFKILLDSDTKANFYRDLDTAISEAPYNVISSVIDKEKYIKKYGKLKNDVYEIALSFIIERTIFLLDGKNIPNIKLNLIIEKRGKKEDAKLKNHIYNLLRIGTYYVTPQRLNSYNIKVYFVDKKENINGLQLSDLVAYPIARFSMDKERANPAYDLIKPKIYKRGSKMYGLKIFP
ncbi:MAG: DUF3800 domain-containing protein [Eubacteriaceae bacterium]